MKDYTLVPLHTYTGETNTFTGLYFNFRSVTPGMIDIRDIAKGLSNNNRWFGQTKLPLSVAQHSVMVTWAAPDHLKKMALLHDAAEAYTGDINKPLKILLEPTISLIEARIMSAINQCFKLSVISYEAIKPFDLDVCRLEWEYFRRNNPAPLVEFLYEKSGVIHPDIWNHEVAEQMFLLEFSKHFPHHLITP